ncbi:MAG: type I phosphomannose isomerase catalytic subunit [Candidatus Latescibacterota bacterium]|nr:type I phosphomannose isomerase catalytic subunit [Candidatus Latescibacterota bacterium]
MSSSLPDILPMQSYLRELVWGGRRLASLGKELPAGDVPIGESFEVSALPGQQSVVATGELAGRSLIELIDEYEAELVGNAVWQQYGHEFPLLIKLIDAHQDLSIQVHPDDAHARAEGLGRYGKTEAWYILDSKGGRIAMGLQLETNPESLRQAIAEGRAEDQVTFHDIRAGDVAFVPAGTVHALCAGVLLYEVQQSSDLTFRLYDYDRPGLDGRKRELHVDRALAVADFESRPSPVSAADGDEVVLVDADPFCLVRHRRTEATLETGPTFAVITVIGDSPVAVAGDWGQVPLAPGGTALVPAGRTVEMRSAAEDGTATWLVATPGTGFRT